MADEGEPSAQLWAVADLATPMAVRVAATLRIADHIASGLRTAPELATAIGVDADILERLLRHLATKGVLSRDDAGQYALSPPGLCLRDDHRGGIRARLDLDGAVGRADLSFAQLLHTVRTGEPAFHSQFGRTFWEDLATDPDRLASFDNQMGADVSAWAPAVISAYDWGSLDHLVDVGGGNGSLMTALLTEHPTLRGTVLSTYSAPLTFDSQTGRVASVLITVNLKVILPDRRGKVLYQNSAYVFREQYEVSTELNSFFEEDSPALERLSRDFARTLIANILEGF